ncbi:Sua5/YciO/YrdC/YwlC family protein [Engelhardtia mirabilis]|uniref:protein-tyrosine-phosphatase n=1 Tax=Engelhardtia mirabilis TaxID=2528011 RepID=A0A518BJQ0_9BACT|nr:Low molecular weight protein-tyrosine-phosphatase YwlE [Planctomycetes bacterium Pla133]QDV01525.1 Low molecular weight protein-tyrosine-phosphatase YwlE [Planctomycetes bacterium Pla86]
MTATCKRIPLPDRAPSNEAVSAIAQALDGGGVVGLPTECGYVLAADVNDPGVLAAFGSNATPLVQAVAGPNRATGDLQLQPLVARLVERYWPGPLTIDGIASDARRRAFRATAHVGTRGLVEALGHGLVWTPASDAEGAALTDADAVERVHGSGLRLLADGGPTRLAEAAAVLRVGPGAFELTREGLLPIESLRQTAGLSIGFVCTGNTCRSPMAETLARADLARRLASDDLTRFGFSVVSAGVFAGPGSPPSAHAVTAMAERGLDLEGHRSRSATPELIASLDRVYCLTRSHLEALRMSLPPGRADHLDLLDPQGGDVPDPVGGSLDDYQRCARAIAAMVSARGESWA